MATYSHLIEEEEDERLREWDNVEEIRLPTVRVVSDDIENMVIVDAVHEPVDKQPLLNEEEEEERGSDGEEEGVKGVADVDYLPENENEISMVRGDIVLIQGQTLDQCFYSVINLRTSESGEVPTRYITIAHNDDSLPVPTQSKLQRSNVVLRKRPASRNGNRKTGSLFADNLTVSLPQSTDDREPSNSISATRERLHHSDSYMDSLPMEYRRLEKYRILSVSGSDKVGRPVIIFSACQLPPSYQINHDTLFEYLKYTLDQYVENDYTVVYFHHGLSSANKPTFSWLYQIYKELDRKYKKNLKKLYVVHPTTFVKVMMTLFKPIISVKFGRKLVYINRLSELDAVLYTDQMDIPKEIIQYDKTLRVPPRSTLPSESRSSFYFSLEETLPCDGSNLHQQFSVPIEVLKGRSGEDIPLVMRLCVEYLTDTSLQILGIFRRTPSQFNVQTVKKAFNHGEPVDLYSYADPHLAATLLKMFLRELPEPLLTFSLHSRISQLKGLSEEQRIELCSEFIDSLPDLNYKIFKYLIDFLTKVLEYEEDNKMSVTNLSIVFGPNLLWSQNEVATLNSMSEINRFTNLILNNASSLFKK